MSLLKSNIQDIKVICTEIKLRLGKCKEDLLVVITHTCIDYYLHLFRGEGGSGKTSVSFLGSHKTEKCQATLKQIQWKKIILDYHMSWILYPNIFQVKFFAPGSIAG